MTNSAYTVEFFHYEQIGQPFIFYLKKAFSERGLTLDEL
jgi:hypothetical protein